MSSDLYSWWQQGVVYQIYPRSFQDSNNDGIGDLQGIIQRLDYLKSLQMAGIWISPIYPSPMYDFGYDVSDYTDIHPIFGTMADFDRLLEETHQRGLKLILDLVPNHTSTEHAWFEESRSSRDNPKRDWYFWRDPAPDGGPPNNWLSCFGGSAWTWDEATEQYYMHSFEEHQPDLNYRNPEVLAAMLDVMRFWLGKGIDGFRVDVIEFMLKDEQLRDEPLDPDWNGVEPYGRLKHIHSRNLPGVHDLIRRMRAVVNEYDDRVLIGEVFVFDEAIAHYYGKDHDGCHLPFNFRLIYKEWNAAVVKQAVDSYEAALKPGHWPNWVLGNHDQHRIATRLGVTQARVANMLLLTLRGTPTVYYGDEIGMEDVPIPPEKVQDPPAVNQPEVAHIFGRDPERTPMQWNDSPNAGFAGSDVEPWLPLAEDYQTRNVAQQQNEPDSMLNLFRALTRLRQQHPALSIGHYASIDVGKNSVDDVFVYTRWIKGGETFLIALNMSENEHVLDVSKAGKSAVIEVSTDMNSSGAVDFGGLRLRPDQGLVLRIE